MMSGSQPLAYQHFQAPLPVEVSGALMTLLSHKGPPWVDDIRCRMRAGRRDSRDHYFVASLGQQLVAHVWYTVSANDHRLGLLGHVYTRPEFRRRGIAARLLSEAMNQFYDRGGQVMQLFTSTPYTVDWYRQLGFENLAECRDTFHACDWYLRGPPGSTDRVNAWFTPADCRVRSLTEADLPAFCLLYNLEHQTLLKDWSLQVGSGVDAELAFIGALDRMARHRAVCLVLETDQALVGLMSLTPSDFVLQPHLAWCDLCVAPGFSGQVSLLWDRCRAECAQRGIETMVAVAVDAAKADLFRQLGFRVQATLRQYVKSGQRSVDAQLFQLCGSAHALPHAGRKGQV